jgi:quercetin dioxygenase-like cupin family protein
LQIYRFDRAVARPIPAFASVNAFLARGVRTTAPAQISCFYLEPGGVVGYHQAPCPQLLLVVQGEGWVRAGGEERVPVRAGDAVFWEAGEWHETGTETGLVALPVESEGLAPGIFMPAR